MTTKLKAAIAAAFVIGSVSAAAAQYYMAAPGYYDPYAAYGTYNAYNAYGGAYAYSGYGPYDAWGHYPVEDGASRESFGGY